MKLLFRRRTPSFLINRLLLGRTAQQKQTLPQTKPQFPRLIFNLQTLTRQANEKRLKIFLGNFCLSEKLLTC